MNKAKKVRRATTEVAPGLDKKWKPVLRGIRYCSPGCGSGCLHAQWRMRKREAAALARALGKGWYGYVWENVGWHASAKNPSARVEVYQQGARRFWATTTDDGNQFQGEAATPLNAIAILRNAMFAEQHRLQHIRISLDMSMETT